MSTAMQCNQYERAALTEAVHNNRNARQELTTAVSNAQQTEATLNAVAMTIIKIRGLDPQTHRLNFDLEKGLFEIEPLPDPATPPDQVEAAEPEAQPERG